jgi:outer membrane biosynthesis protein TonB
MKRSIYVIAVTGLMLLLAACGTTETATVQSDFATATSAANQPNTPTPEPPMKEEMAATEESMANEETVAKEPTATTEIMPTEEMAEPTEEVMEAPTEEAMAEDKEEMAEQMDMPQPTEAQQQLLTSLPIVGTPPELNNEVWLNSDPLQLADLRGNVVIVEFWTYG